MSRFSTRLHRRSARTIALRLGAARTAIGTGYVLAPVPAARALGADAATAARASWLTRMMGVRDAALGAGTILAARRDHDARTWLVAGAVCDALDAMVVAGAVRSGRMRGPVPVLVAAGAASATGYGLVAAARLDRPAR